MNRICKCPQKAKNFKSSSNRICFKKSQIKAISKKFYYSKIKSGENICIWKRF